MLSLLSSARARIVAIAVAMVGVLLLSGCIASSTPVNRSTGPTLEAVPAVLVPYYHQTLDWAECGRGQQCATATVPMDWAHPSSATDITLALTRASASGARIGSLFVNPGGPGASGYDLVHDTLDFAVSPALRERFDVIGWDPRGVGRSTPVKCLDDTGLDALNYGIAANPVNTPAWVREETSDAKRLAAACLKNTGPILEFVDTMSTVHDLDMLRAVVGDRKLNYLGYSYGSDIGMYYANSYPAKVGRVVLDGATDSTLSVFDINLAQSKAFEDALRAYLSDCPSTSNCPFPGSVESSLATISALDDRLGVAPIFSNSRVFDNNVLQTAINSALYDRSSWQYLNNMFAELKGGTTGTGFLLADSYNGRSPNGKYTDNSTVAFLAIACLDYPTVTDPAEIARNNEQLANAAPTLKRLSVVGDLVCQNWPFHNRTPPPVVTGSGAAPILILSSTGDPATPYQWGVALAKQLQSAHLITRTGEGHTAFNRGLPCIDDAVDNYFVRGTVPTRDPLCRG